MYSIFLNGFLFFPSRSLFLAMFLTLSLFAVRWVLCSGKGLCKACDRADGLLYCFDGSFSCLFCRFDGSFDGLFCRFNGFFNCLFCRFSGHNIGLFCSAVRRVKGFRQLFFFFFQFFLQLLCFFNFFSADRALKEELVIKMCNFMTGTGKFFLEFLGLGVFFLLPSLKI